MVNPSDTELLLFTRRYKPHACKPHLLKSLEIDVSIEVKYLTIILDSKVIWNRNTIESSKSAATELYAFTEEIGKTRGLRPHMSSFHAHCRSIANPCQICKLQASCNATRLNAIQSWGTCAGHIKILNSTPFSA